MLLTFFLVFWGLGDRWAYVLTLTPHFLSPPCPILLLGIPSSFIRNVEGPSSSRTPATHSPMTLGARHLQVLGTTVPLVSQGLQVGKKIRKNYNYYSNGVALPLLSWSPAASYVPILKAHYPHCPLLLHNFVSKRKKKERLYNVNLSSTNQLSLKRKSDRNHSCSELRLKTGFWYTLMYIQYALLGKAPTYVSPLDKSYSMREAGWAQPSE